MAAARPEAAGISGRILTTRDWVPEAPGRDVRDLRVRKAHSDQMAHVAAADARRAVNP